MISNYLQFIARELPTTGSPTALDVVPDFNRRTVLWTLFFSALHVAYPWLARSFRSKWFASLSQRDRKDISSYIVCTIHHLAMVPLAWSHIYHDAMLSMEESKLANYPVVEANVAPFVIGYLMGDTLCYALPEMFQLRFEFFVHHVLTLYLILTSMTGPGYFCRYIPHLIICDTTNIFFNIAWVLRRCGYKNSGIVSALEIIFAITFFFVRVVNLPLVFVQAMLHPSVVEWGLARFTLLPIILMQWYWFAKIVGGVRKKFLQNRPHSGAAQVLPASGRKAKDF
jgi:hypothetical protein